MPEPTVENQIKLCLLKNHIISIEVYNKKCYLLSYSSVNIEDIDLTIQNTIMLNNSPNVNFEDDEYEAIVDGIVIQSKNIYNADDNHSNLIKFTCKINNVEYDMFIEEFYNPFR